MAQAGPSKEEIIRTFQMLRQQQAQLEQKISELNIDIDEHRLVEEALASTDPSRKCFRSVGGVLVERNVAEVLPAIRQNKDQIQKMVEGLTATLEKKTKEAQEFQQKYQIRVQGQGAGGRAEQEGGEASKGQGVLVS